MYVNFKSLNFAFILSYCTPAADDEQLVKLIDSAVALNTHLTLCKSLTLTFKFSVSVK